MKLAVYFFVLVCIGLIPLLYQLPLILTGRKAEAEVAFHYDVPGTADGRFKGGSKRVMFRFYTKKGETIIYEGPDNVYFSQQKKWPIYYDPKNPENNILFH